MKCLLPSWLESKAFHARNGERAWHKEDLAGVLMAYAEAEVPVESYEVWIVNDLGQWNGTFPLKDGTEALCVYDVQPRRPDESQKTFAQRCCHEILAKVREIDIESQIADKALQWVRYNLYAEDEYKSE